LPPFLGCQHLPQRETQVEQLCVENGALRGEGIDALVQFGSVDFTVLGEIQPFRKHLLLKLPMRSQGLLDPGDDRFGACPSRGSFDSFHHGGTQVLHARGHDGSRGAEEQGVEDVPDHSCIPPCPLSGSVARSATARKRSSSSQVASSIRRAASSRMASTRSLRRRLPSRRLLSTASRSLRVAW
jgi:hypothetical protein